MCRTRDIGGIALALFVSGKKSTLKPYSHCASLLDCGADCIWTVHSKQVQHFLLASGEERGGVVDLGCSPNA